MLAVPAMAQVDQSVILGATGTGTCTSLQEIRAARLTVSTAPTHNSIGISWSQEQRIFLLFGISESLGNVLQVSLGVAENRVPSSLISSQKLGTVTNLAPLAAGSHTFTGLKQNTPYVIVLYSTTSSESWGNDSALARLCFRTAADLEIPFGSGRAVGPGDSWSSGCYAFSKDQNQIRACLCGARNSDGNWARTDAEDGYEYIRDANWRTTTGCTTN